YIFETAYPNESTLELQIVVVAAAGSFFFKKFLWFLISIHQGVFIFLCPHTYQNNIESHIVKKHAI
ncbi:hypothetical protein ACJX0J_034834, partial [Zea mays]